MSFQSYLDKSLYPGGMDVSVGTVPTPAVSTRPTSARPTASRRRNPRSPVCSSKSRSTDTISASGRRSTVCR